MMGFVEKVGDAVSGIKPGDRVVLPFNIACGFCVDVAALLAGAQRAANDFACRPTERGRTF